MQCRVCNHASSHTSWQGQPLPTHTLSPKRMCITHLQQAHCRVTLLACWMDGSCYSLQVAYLSGRVSSINASGRITFTCTFTLLTLACLPSPPVSRSHGGAHSRVKAFTESRGWRFAPVYFVNQKDANDWKRLWKIQVRIPAAAVWELTISLWAGVAMPTSGVHAIRHFT